LFGQLFGEGRGGQQQVGLFKKTAGQEFPEKMMPKAENFRAMPENCGRRIWPPWQKAE